MPRSRVARTWTCERWQRSPGAPTTSTYVCHALEGFLLRLAASASSQDFVLKGGVLLAAYQLRRPTADIDFAALKISNDVGAITSMIITVADTQLPDDQDDGQVGVVVAQVLTDQTGDLVAQRRPKDVPDGSDPSIETAYLLSKCHAPRGPMPNGSDP